PGTSKTALVEQIAYALDWRFIEIHAGDFVAKGYQEIGQTADDIFSILMELDHCVILFDEVDELVRERAFRNPQQEQASADMFGRFLTTSMLPKLAELWKQRKILYFVATNHLEYFDEAIKRSQRFDAHLFVAPPSFEKKKKVLNGLLEKDLQLNKETII